VLRIALFRHIIYPSYWRWAYNKRYLGQDQRVLEHLYDGPERLQANDSGIVAWRRLSARAGHPKPQSWKRCDRSDWPGICFLVIEDLKVRTAIESGDIGDEVVHDTDDETAACDADMCRLPR
jgi:hypothetical protein